MLSAISRLCSRSRNNGARASDTAFSVRISSTEIGLLRSATGLILAPWRELMSGRKHTLMAILLSAGFLHPSAEAQFHSKSQNGQAAVNPQAIQQAQMQAAGAAGASHAMAGAAFSGGDMILPEGKRQALSNWNPRISQMNGKYADVWGRAIHHTNGNFTESKQDMESNTLEQETKSRNGITLQKRMIMLDQSGRPSEVLIYDGNDQFKYRGVLLHDTLGRFVEEQVYDAKGTLIRRKVQEYTPQGLRKPLRSWDYVANVPADLQLIITDEAPPGEKAPTAQPETQKRGFFGQARPNQAAPAGQANQNGQAQPNQQGSTSSGTSEKRKGLGLGRIFGNKN